MEDEDGGLQFLRGSSPNRGHFPLATLTPSFSMVMSTIVELLGNLGELPTGSLTKLFSAEDRHQEKGKGIPSILGLRFPQYPRPSQSGPLLLAPVPSVAQLPAPLTREWAE